MTDVTAALLPALKPLAALADAAFDALVALSAGVAAGTKGPADLAAAPALRGLAGLPPVHEALVAVYLDCARLGTAGDDLAKALAPALPAGARRRSRRSSTRAAARSSPRSRTAASARPRWSTSRGSARPSSRRASAPTRARSTS